ncbi:MAG: hypothetical protein ACR2O4_02945 [Hyphomicrobiaceae bacterium]
MFPASEMVTQWDGLLVHKSEVEERNPQEFVRAKRDPEALTDVRPRAPSADYCPVRYTKVSGQSALVDNWPYGSIAAMSYGPQGVIFRPGIASPAATIGFAKPTNFGVAFETDIADTIISVPYPPGLQVGDALIALVAVDGAGGTFSPAPPGWASFGSTTSGVNLTTGHFRRVADGSESGTQDFTYTGSSTSVLGGMMWRITGADVSTPTIWIDQTSASSGSGTTATCPSVITTGSNRLILRYVAAQDDVAPSTAPAGHTLKFSRNAVLGSGLMLAGAFEYQASAGASGTADFSLSGSTLASFAYTTAIEPATMSESFEGMSVECTFQVYPD